MFDFGASHSVLDYGIPERARESPGNGLWGLQVLFMLSIYRRSGVFITMSRAVIVAVALTVLSSVVAPAQDWEKDSARPPNLPAAVVPGT